MNTLDYILDKFSLTLGPKEWMPVEIPNAGRNTLAELFHELDYRTGAEIGVQRGKYTAYLCQMNPQATIYGVDSYQEYAGYPDKVDQDGFDIWKADMQNRLAPYPNFTLIQKFSMDAVKDFAPNALDFVYIDGNHALRYAVEDIVEWSKVVRVGGIVSGHDFSQAKWRDEEPHNLVYEAVQAYTSGYLIRPWFVLGRKNETDPTAIRERPRSWMWVKLK